jgi:glycerol-3-phosphate dehydrogenase
VERIETEVLVIGGGATGTGVVRDLAIRGFSAVLVEKGDLTHGTTGRYHGLLHSGGRYVIKDPHAAQECVAENQVLRNILPDCIEDTGGFFVLTEWDDEEYAPRFLDGCRRARIPVEEITIQQMLREESVLNPHIRRCFRVPDASADSFLAADLNAGSARGYGAQILNYHRVTKLIQADKRIAGALCHNLEKDELVEILADMVINASGAWAGRIAALAGIKVHVIPGKGTMIAMNHRIVNTVINRCKMPSDGDILVPAHTVAVIGTTDVRVEDPDFFAIEPWEVHLLLAEGEKIVPGFKEMRMLRAWAGVRPLYEEVTVMDTRDVTRAFVLLDHADRDGIEGFITITGGKWTTYRKMAEMTVDLVCRKLGTTRACRTHLEPMLVRDGRDRPGEKKHKVFPGERLERIEKRAEYGQLVCECELATEGDVIHAIQGGSVKTIDDVRRDVRLGMGPCQGGFCTYRVAGLLHRLRPASIAETNLALRDFLQERWKGLLPILWGQQLRQERLDELIYLSILNTDHLPGPRRGLLSPDNYAPPENSPSRAEIHETNPDQEPQLAQKENGRTETIHPQVSHNQVDLLVIGAGISGLIAAWQAGMHGASVRLISKGWGGLYWQPGCIDILGYSPLNPEMPVESPARAIQELLKEHSAHPYAKAGIEVLSEAAQALKTLCAKMNYPLHGSIESNWLLPSALGAPRPTCLAPEMMIAGDLRKTDPILIVGFEGFQDFYPDLIADNLSAQGISSRGVFISNPELADRRFVNARTLADLFEFSDFCDQVSLEIEMQISRISGFRPKRIGFPAVLGLKHPLQVKARLERKLGLEIFEIPTFPPSIPGIRLNRLLIEAIEQCGGRVFDGMQATGWTEEGEELIALRSEAASRSKQHHARSFVLATGGILGGGLYADYQGSVTECVFQIPVKAPGDWVHWLNRDFLAAGGHPIFEVGIETDRHFHPLGKSGRRIFKNLYAVGDLLAGVDSIRERSREGIALVSGYFVGNLIGRMK